METTLSITNPFTFKESLLVAVEVTDSFLNHLQIGQIYEIINKVPNSLPDVTITLSSTLTFALKSCIQSFKQTATYNWLREDFKEAITDIEQQLNGLKHSLS